MKSKVIALGIFVATAATVGLFPMLESPATAGMQHAVANETDQSKIQLAILLDTSSSMSGLINQTRDQLWQMVNEFAKSKKDGKTPILEVAVYEYGNSGLNAGTGYIRQVTPLTRELDQVSEALFALKTNGGDEYCGYVINTVVQELNWSKNDQDIKTIFIAGNEPFTQGPVPFQLAINAAKAKGITVNTIHAGSNEEGTNTGWRDGALLAGGEYMNIDQNHQVAHIDAPQDKRLAELNSRLNSTYIPFGEQGREKRDRQQEQDKQSNAVSAALLAKRAAAKASPLYDNRSWDLVDAKTKGVVDLDKLNPEQLPQEMLGMNKQQQKLYVEEKAQQRQQIKSEISKLNSEREAYVKNQQAAAPSPAVNTVKEAMSQAIRKQGEKKQYQFDSN